MRSFAYFIKWIIDLRVYLETCVLTNVAVTGQCSVIVPAQWGTIYSTEARRSNSFFDDVRALPSALIRRSFIFIFQKKSCERALSVIKTPL